MNKIILTGRLTKDCELKKMKNEKSTEFVFNTIAVKHMQMTQFINIMAYGKTADYLAKYSKKGTFIEVVGNLEVKFDNDKKAYEFVCVKVETADIISGGITKDEANNKVGEDSKLFDNEAIKWD